MAHHSDGGGQTPAAAGIYTDTLARLYVQQGFVEKALTIYRHLAQVQPEQAQWHDRIAALERQLQEPLPAPGEVPDYVTSAVSTPYHTVMAQLERWLRRLQRQRLLEAESGGGHTEQAPGSAR
jgi:hypothetical protein